MSGSSSTKSKGRFLDFSVMVTNQSHHRSVHNNITVLVVLAVVMAPGLPIYRSTFSAGGDIGPVLSTNLHVKAGNRGGEDSIASCSLGSIILETIFLVEGFPSFCLPFFGSFSVDC
jgi:hypothetical protein